MSAVEPRLVCAGCGRAITADTPLPFRCVDFDAYDDVDHVVSQPGPPTGAEWPAMSDPNPFVSFRSLLYSWHLARQRGMTDAEYVRIVRALDSAIADIDGKGFTTTPYTQAPALAAELGLADGGLWVKDETGNVSGSHKARHLMGVAIYLAVAEQTGLLSATEAKRPLAIASCGNAALAAAIVARAAGRRLRVFVPTWAEPTVLDQLQSLDADLEICERRPGDGAGDPCYLRFRSHVANGALPFSCQGPDNGLTIEGGMTLGWEAGRRWRSRELLCAGTALGARSGRAGSAPDASRGPDRVRPPVGARLASLHRRGRSCAPQRGERLGDSRVAASES